jgi:hypothetical protein
LEKEYFSNIKTRDSLAPTKSTKGGPKGNTLADVLKKAMQKASAEKFDDDEPNYNQVDVPYTNILRNLQQTSKLYTKEALDA